MNTPNSSKPNFLPGPVPNFTKFNKYSTINAYTPSRDTEEINTIDQNFFTMMKNNPPEKIPPPPGSIKFGVDENNNFTINKISCMYPNSPSPSDSYILAYRLIMDNGNSGGEIINENNNNQNVCMNNPPEVYSTSFMPDCLDKCIPMNINPGTLPIYNCNNNQNNNNNQKNDFNSFNIYIPRGGWLGVGMAKENILKNTPSSSIINSSAPFNSKQINVIKDDGSPIYIANNNSTSDINTWTKLQDLCIRE
jgi:hypothetical protein